MKNTIKSIAFVLAAPIALTIIFQVNVIKVVTPSRSPAVETKQVKEISLKQSVEKYLVAVNK
jgi:hypothetical protein